MSQITYKETFKIVVYLDNKAIGAIKKHPSRDEYRYSSHGGREKGEWMSSINAIKDSIEGDQ